MDAAVIPSGFFEHKKKKTLRAQHYWYFNKKLLYNKLFCESFTHLWGKMEVKKKFFMKLKVNGGRLERCI